jgi:hypothetical protein
MDINIVLLNPKVEAMGPSAPTHMAEVGTLFFKTSFPHRVYIQTKSPTGSIWKDIEGEVENDEMIVMNDMEPSDHMVIYEDEGGDNDNDDFILMNDQEEA